MFSVAPEPRRCYSAFLFSISKQKRNPLIKSITLRERLSTGKVKCIGPTLEPIILQTHNNDNRFRLGEAEPIIRNLHLMQDHLVPNYTVSPWFSFVNKSKKDKFMTFTDEQGKHVAIHFKKRHVVLAIAERVEMDMDPEEIDTQEYWKHCQDKYREAALSSLNFTPSVGREVLSWLSMFQCCVQEKDIPGFIEFSKVFSYDGFADFFKSNGIYPQSENNSHKISIFYHTSNIPPRDASKIQQGIHLFGADDQFLHEFASVPILYFILKEGEENSDLEEVKHCKECCKRASFGPVLKVSLEGDTINHSRTRRSLDKLELFMLYSLFNSFQIRSREKGKRWHLPRHRRDFRWMLQIKAKDPATMRKASSMLSLDNQSLCTLKSQVPSFFGDLFSDQHLLTFASYVSEDQEKFLLSFQECQGGDNDDTWCAVKFSSCYMHQLLQIGLNKAAIYNPFEKSLIVYRPSVKQMFEFVQAFNINTYPRHEPLSCTELHLIEAMPGLDIAEVVSAPR